MHNPTIIALLIAGSMFSALPCASASDDPSRLVPVIPLTSAPVVDGIINDWPGLEQNWEAIEVFPALKDDTQNETGHKGVAMVAGVFGDKIYFAFHWADDSKNELYKPWYWRQNRYERGKDRDDMFAIRFHMDGDYDTCMLTQNTYRVDVWKWSAGRSNPAGLAEDMTHLLSQTPLENAAEYGDPGHMIYIKKDKDSGEAFFDTRRVGNTLSTEVIDSIKILTTQPSSYTDVEAKGVWANGFWTLEMARKLNTGHSDDVVFRPGQKLLGAIAVFNKGYAEHKSVNGNLLFDFSAIK